MEHLRTIYTAHVRCRFTKVEVLNLKLIAETHYDRVCKAAAERGGFLYAMRNAIGQGDSVEWNCEFHDLDILNKILERDPFNPLKAQIHQLLKHINEEYRRLNE